MSIDETSRQRIESIVNSSDVLLFMKGDRSQPQCGFSATVIGILDQLLPEYQTLDVLSDPEIRENIKDYSSWPTIPQLYVKGEFIGGCDIIQELFATGELQETLGIDFSQVAAPSISITDSAAEMLRTAIEQNSGDNHDLHLSIDARFQNKLFFGPNQPTDLEVEVNGTTLRIDPLSAGRGEGLVIDVVETDRGPGFQIDNPNAPKIIQLDVKELKAKIDAGETFEFLDVRTPQERATASIGGTLLLTDEVTARLEQLPRDTPLVFHCHTGVRSQQAAEHFSSLGFTNIFNVAGGIDAWSSQIDSDVPRY